MKTFFMVQNKVINKEEPKLLQLAQRKSEIMRKPNVLFIMADQWNESCFSGYRHPDVKTPNLDTLIEGGVSFRNCFVANPTCQPSRTSFFTSQYVHTHGVECNDNSAPPRGTVHSLAGVFKNNGYKTGAFGKLHLGEWERDAGFDSIEHVCDDPFGEDDYSKYLKEKGLYEDYMRNERKPFLERRQKFWSGKSNIPMKNSNENWTVDRTINFLDAVKDDPFFAWCTFERPHAPHTPPKDAPVTYDPAKLTLPPYDPHSFDTKRYHSRPGVENLWKAWVQGEDNLREGLANYYELVSLIDHNIGRLVNYLEERDLLENTIIIFTADHGDFAGNYGMLGKNSANYDAIIRTPYIWYWKGRFDRNMYYDLVEAIDMYPTLCDLCGIETPPSVQGDSHIDAMTDKNYFAGKDAVFSERHFMKTIRTRTHKLSVSCNGDKVTGELYELVEDPRELKNRFNDPALAHIQKKLYERLLCWFVRTTQPTSCSFSSEIVDKSLRWHSFAAASRK